jgi:hypothetical protein
MAFHPKAYGFSLWCPVLCVHDVLKDAVVHWKSRLLIFTIMPLDVDLPVANSDVQSCEIGRHSLAWYTHIWSWRETWFFEFTPKSNVRRVALKYTTDLETEWSEVSERVLNKMW